MNLRSFLVVCSLPAFLLAGCLGADPKSPEIAPAKAPVAAEKRVAGPYRSYVNIPCDKVASGLQNKGSRNDFLLMINGFISGTNYMKGRTDNLDINAMAALVENYCRQNPAQTMTNALIALDSAADRRSAAPRAPQSAATGAVKNLPAINGGAATPGTQAPLPRPVEPSSRTNMASTASFTAPAVVPPPVSAASPPGKPTVGGDYIVLVISTKEVAEANRVSSKLNRSSFPATVERVNLGDKGIWYRVITGPYRNEVAAKKAAAQLTAANYSSVLVRKR